MFNLITLPISGLKALLVIVLFFYSLKMPAQKVSESSSKNFEYTVSKPYRVVDALVKDYFHYGESIIVVEER